MTVYSQDVFTLLVIKIALNVSKFWQKINEYATRFIKQAHIIEQLCPVINI